jgi:phosphate transport system permease protein
MTTSNSTADQVFDPQHAAELREKRKQTISNSLAKRHRKEKTFRFFGFSAVIAGLFFVALLFGSILSKGLPAFWQSSMSLPVYFDPAIITTGAKPVQRSGESPAQFEERFIAWQTEMGMVDWDALIVNAMIVKDPALASKRDDLASLYTSSEAYRLRDMVMKDPSLVGKKEDIKVLADANVDVWLAGNIDRSLPDEQQQLSPEVRQLADEMKASGVMENTFNTNIFVPKARFT